MSAVSFAKRTALLIAAATVVFSGCAQAATWQTNKAASRIGFSSAFDGMNFSGSFQSWDAKIQFDPANLKASNVTVTVDLASARSGDHDRDAALPTQDWFAVAKFPRATYTTTDIRDLGGGRYVANGFLSLKGVRQPLAINFSLNITGNQATMRGQATVSRNLFKVGEGQFSGPDTVPFAVPLTITVVATSAN